MSTGEVRPVASTIILSTNRGRSPISWAIATPVKLWPQSLIRFHKRKCKDVALLGFAVNSQLEPVRK
jgi:hypothetical protein